MQEFDKQQLTDRFVDLIEQINQQMHCRPLDDWEGLDLTIPQIKALALLQHQGPLRMGSISNYLGSTFSAATSIIERLVDKDLVERVPDPDDRRVVICRLTAAGHGAVEKFWGIGRMRIVELSECLNVVDLEAVVRGMELLLQAAADSGKKLAPQPQDL